MPPYPIVHAISGYMPHVDRSVKPKYDCGRIGEMISDTHAELAARMIVKPNNGNNNNTYVRNHSVLVSGI